MMSKVSSYPVPFKRTQYPVLGAYYLTINRAQGQTLERAGLYLEESVFTHGHLYVGFGRCGDPRSFLFMQTKQNLNMFKNTWTKINATQETGFFLSCCNVNIFI